MLEKCMPVNLFGGRGPDEQPTGIGDARCVSDFCWEVACPQFTGWPDHGIPKFTYQLIHLLRPGPSHKHPSPPAECLESVCSCVAKVFG